MFVQIFIVVLGLSVLHFGSHVVLIFSFIHSSFHIVLKNDQFGIWKLTDFVVVEKRWSSTIKRWAFSCPSLRLTFQINKASLFVYMTNMTMSKRYCVQTVQKSQFKPVLEFIWYRPFLGGDGKYSRLFVCNILNPRFILSWSTVKHTKCNR